MGVSLKETGNVVRYKQVQCTEKGEKTTGDKFVTLGIDKTTNMSYCRKAQNSKFEARNNIEVRMSKTYLNSKMTEM